MLKQVQLRLHAARLLRSPSVATPSRWDLLRRRYTQESSSTEGSERAIHERLAKRFEPSKLMVQDVSGGCGTFYAITIASKAFQGASIVKQHRMVNEELKDVIQNIHGLQLKTIAE